MKIGIVVSEFHYDITSKMLERAKVHAKLLGAEVGGVIWVPGSFDMPLAIKRLLEEKDIEGVATLGVVIKGDTNHDEVVANQAARKITDLSLQFGKPVSLGIIGPNATRAMAVERIEEYAKRSVESVVKMGKMEIKH